MYPQDHSTCMSEDGPIIMDPRFPGPGRIVPASGRGTFKLVLFNPQAECDGRLSYSMDIFFIQIRHVITKDSMTEWGLRRDSDELNFRSKNIWSRR
jgi:hypothetical protein